MKRSIDWAVVEEVFARFRLATARSHDIFGSKVLPVGTKGASASLDTSEESQLVAGAIATLLTRSCSSLAASLAFT